MGEIKVTDDNCKTTADDVKVQSFVIIAVVGLAYQQILGQLYFSALALGAFRYCYLLCLDCSSGS